MYRFLPTLGAFSAAVAILTGAFGAHGLKATVTPEFLSAWSTAAHYHLIHSVALFFASRSLRENPPIRDVLPSYLFAAGILCFSGSLYAMVLTGMKIFGPITPFGGLLFTAGWISLAWNHMPNTPSSPEN